MSRCKTSPAHPRAAVRIAPRFQDRPARSVGLARGRAGAGGRLSSGDVRYRAHRSHCDPAAGRGWCCWELEVRGVSSAVTNVMCVLLVEMRLIGKQTSFSGPTLFTAFDPVYGIPRPLSPLNYLC